MKHPVQQPTKIAIESANLPQVLQAILQEQSDGNIALEIGCCL